MCSLSYCLCWHSNPDQALDSEYTWSLVKGVHELRPSSSSAEVDQGAQEGCITIFHGLLNATMEFSVLKVGQMS